MPTIDLTLTTLQQVHAAEILRDKNLEPRLVPADIEIAVSRVPNAHLPPMFP